jgi:hypothetical protein
MKKLQLNRKTISALARERLAEINAGAHSETFSVRNNACSGTCTCSQPCTQSCRPCQI